MLNFKHETKQWILSPKGRRDILKRPQEKIFHIVPVPDAIQDLAVSQNVMMEQFFYIPQELKLETEADK